jgi:hypothetical protein
MRKQLFDTKIKDGIWLCAILAIVVATSLSLDDVQGSLRPGKIRVTIYVPSYEVPSDGPQLKPGDAIKLYKKIVGRVDTVDFFVAVVKKPQESDAQTMVTTSAMTSIPQRVVRSDIVSGLKLTAELYRGQYPQILSLVTPDSNIRVESATLGDSAILLSVAQTGDPVTDGSIINFPRNHASLFDPKDPRSRYGKELTDPAEIVRVRREITSQPSRKGTADPEKKNPADDF